MSKWFVLLFLVPGCPSLASKIRNPEFSHTETERGQRGRWILRFIHIYNCSTDIHQPNQPNTNTTKTETKSSHAGYYQNTQFTWVLNWIEFSVYMLSYLCLIFHFHITLPNSSHEGKYAFLLSFILVYSSPLDIVYIVFLFIC